MIKHNQDGVVSGLGISLVLCVLLLIAAIAFGGWAFSSRQDYKNHSDQKAADAADAARQAESVKKDKEFAEEAKNPLKTYQGPDAYGSLAIQYPKTWSGYVDDSGNGSNNSLLDGYFAPGEVPSINAKTSVFALRVQVINKSYADTLKDISNSQRNTHANVTAYAFPKLPKVVGVMVTGKLNDQDPADTTMVVVPLRSQTLEVWTQGNQYLNDFNQIILANFTFSP